MTQLPVDLDLGACVADEDVTRKLVADAQREDGFRPPEFQLLTNSRIESFKRCRKRCFWEYEYGIRRDIDAKPLRMGTAYHAGLHQLKLSGCVDEAVASVRAEYATMPSFYDTVEWEIERETVAALASGYAWRWQDAPLKVVAAEQSYELPLTNPETEAASKLFHRAGKIDGIVQLEDGRLAVLEHKLLGEDIGSDSDFWLRMQLDMQVTGYAQAARDLGHAVDTVLSDIARKPTIRPTPVAVCDDLGAKIVLDANGQRVRTEKGQWRQTGDSAKGYTVQTCAMTADEFASKLTEDIGTRPDFYFQRREIPRLDQDLDEYNHELWSLQKTIREAQVTGRWFKTVSYNTCPLCPYLSLCTSKYDPADLLPEGFVHIENVHPELE
jgi:hypothetical protein